MNNTTAAYDRMVEDIKERVGADEEPGVLEDIATHSADAGWGGFTYTSECVEFYDAHKDVIWEMLSEDADNMGFDNPMVMVSKFGRADMLDSEDGMKNLLAWYALEEVSRRLVDEGAHLEDEEEEDEEDIGLLGWQIWQYVDGRPEHSLGGIVDWSIANSAMQDYRIEHADLDIRMVPVFESEDE